MKKKKKYDDSQPSLGLAVGHFFYFFFTFFEILIL
jgi:hypothetical protein